jgi:hypothetical protein
LLDLEKNSDSEFRFRKIMKDKFLTNLRVRRCLQLRASAVFLIIVFASLQPASYGQTTVLTRTQFSRYSVVERARFFEPTISRIAAEEAVDPYLLWTIAYNETRFRPWLRSYAGAEGLMQFIPATASRFGLFNPYLPEPAIRAAARYVKFLSNRFGGRIDSILAGYNAGEGAVDAFLTGRAVRSGKKIINASGIKTIGGVPPYRETIGYVARGLVVYRLLRARQMFPGALVSSIYPPAVSESVARVWLNEPEIGFVGTILTQINNPNFSIATTAAQNISVPVGSSEQAIQTKIPPGKSVRNIAVNSPPNLSVVSAETVPGNSPGNDDGNKEKSIASNEVFYEPRTGERFQNRNGKIERLAESSERVVGEQTRLSNAVTSRARGTFFGGATKPISEK